MPTVLVTGANRGMGLAYVRHYRNEGWRVWAACRAGAACEALQELGEGLTAVELDVAEERSLAALGERLAGESLDLVINNAGISGEEGLGSWTAATFAQQFAVNATGPALVAQAVAPLLASGGKLVNITSGMGSLAANPDLAGPLDAYAASKAALNMLTLRLAAQLRERGVTVVALNPGWVQTEMGGPAAPTPIDEAVRRITGVIDRLTIEQTGRFLEDNGADRPW